MSDCQGTTPLAGPPRRVVVVDDHGVVRLGLAALLNQQPDISVVGEAADAAGAYRLVAELQPDLVVMDVRMPGVDGIEACRILVREHPGTNVVLLTAFADEGDMVRALLAGARGYVLKVLDNDDLVRAVRCVASGGVATDPSLARAVMAGLPGPDPGTAQVTADVGTRRHATPEPGPETTHGLTDHDRALLRLVAQGRTNREIAEALYFSEKTIRNYISALLSKLGLRNRAEAAAYATRHGLLKP